MSTGKGIVTNLSSTSENSLNNPNTNEETNILFNTPCHVVLNHIDPDTFTEKLLDISRRKHESGSIRKTPDKKVKSFVVDISTPRTQIEFSQELKRVLNERNVLTSKTKKQVFDALDEIKIKGDEENRSYKKEKALLEIVNSEIKYVHQLEIIINFFLKPTQEHKLLPPDDFSVVFGNILPMYNVNRELLEAIENNSNHIAKAFCKLAPFFKLYSVYACEFKYILNILQNARLLNPQFAKLVENQESRPEVQTKLSALLITPIQRVPRYKLLLTHLLNLTKPFEPDFESLKECLYKIEEAADHINKILEEHENVQRLLELQRYLKSSEPNIVKPGRTLVKEGFLIKMGTKSMPSEKLYTVLMNDIILFGKLKKDELKVNSLKCMRIFPLGKCIVLEILDKGCMKIICQNEELVLYDDRFSETKSWIEVIKRTIESYLSGKKTLRKDSSSRRPVKRKDMLEYHEVGLSPGRPLMKKRKIELESQPSNSVTSSRITGRKAVTRTPFEFKPDVASVSRISESLLHSRQLQDVPSDKSKDSTKKDVPGATSKELLVFGKPENDGGLKVGKIFGALGTSIKKIFGFKS